MKINFLIIAAYEIIYVYFEKPQENGVVILNVKSGGS
jgi:hypothetical protein